MIIVYGADTFEATLFFFRGAMIECAGIENPEATDCLWIVPGTVNLS